MGKVLHASGSGYFPYCIQESTDSRYAIWSLENAMKTYWRVRSWNFSASGTANSGEGGEDFPYSVSVEGIQSGSGDIFLSELYTQEKQLVCGGGFYFGAEGDDLIANIRFGTVKKVGDLYNAGLSGLVYDNIQSGNEYRFGTPTVGMQITSTLSFCGGSIPIGATSLSEEVPVTLLSLTASLTPASWWSYGGTYDTATGEPL
jgi:hypothetical protein